MSDFNKMRARVQNRERDRKLRQDRYFDKLAKILGMKTLGEMRQEREDALEYEYSQVPLETKQSFLDLMNNEGKNVGEAMEILGISLDVAGQVILRNAMHAFPTKANK
jgi:hypothetical protein